MTNTIKKFILLAFIPAVLTVSCAEQATNKSNVVAEKIKAGALVVDVRSNEEVAAGMYQGAKHIPIEQTEARLAEFGPKDGAIVLYCRSGGRAGRVKQLLESQGYTNVTNAGGLKDMP